MLALRSTSKETTLAMINFVGGGPLVLVVEDVEETRDGIEALLKVDGYRVNAARDERDAVRKARRETPNLVLLSLAGRNVDLVAAALRIRRRVGLSQNVPIVIFSVESVPEGTEMEMGKNVWVTSPDNFDQLRRLLRRLLHRPRFAPGVSS